MLVKEGLVSSPYSLITILSNEALTYVVEYIFTFPFFCIITGFFLYSIFRENLLTPNCVVTASISAESLK